MERIKPTQEQMNASRSTVIATHPNARSYYTDNGAAIATGDFGEILAEVEDGEWAVEYAWIVAAERLSAQPEGK